MAWFKTRNLTLHAIRNFAFLPSSTVFHSNEANLCNTTRFYCAPPPPPSPPPLPTDDDEPRGIIGSLQCYFAKSFETVPYTNRTRRILFPKDIERKIGESDFNDFKERYQQNPEMLLSPEHPDVLRVKMVLNGIIEALQRDLKTMGNNSSSYSSIAERFLMTLSRKTPPATTSHLYELDWDVFIVNDPDIPDIPYSHCFYSEGKIVVNQFLVHRLVDLHIAIVFAHQVARIVGRRRGEKKTKEMGITYLNNILGENFTKHIGTRVISHIRKLPFNKRLDVEADYIGLRILASAGYDQLKSTKKWEE